jgi:hypothetical protein
MRLFDDGFVRSAIGRSAENATDRRRFLRSAGLLGVGAVGAGTLGAATAASATTRSAHAQAAVAAVEPSAAVSDAAVLNFALNLEYLEAEFYSYATTGHGIPDSLTTGTYTRGPVTGGHRVPFCSRDVYQYAREIAGDEKDHVAFLRTALGTVAVARPAIDLKTSFTAAARAAGLINSWERFDPFRDEDSFLLGAYIFEDVGVTAYKGAAPLISNKTYLEAAAGILAVEAYHAANVRTVLYQRGLGGATDKISAARDSLDGPTDDDQGTLVDGQANIVPSDANGIAFSRSPGQVLNIVYLTPNAATKGGFFPAGVNGTVNTSA